MAAHTISDERLPRFDTDFGTYLNKMVANRSVQNWVARMPGLRWFAKRDGAEIFDIVQGFVRSQVLMALVQLDLPKRLLEGPVKPEELARECGLEQDRMDLLLNAGTAIGMLKKQFGRYTLTRKGAATVGIPGLRQMILHHQVLYRDMTDPLALLRGNTETELANFWPYVFGPGGANDPDTARTYSDLMADSQSMVARDTLQMVEMRNFRRVLDVGGGTGAFAMALAEADPYVKVDVMDLPSVESAANERIAEAGYSDRITFRPGSFTHDPFPEGADAITLIRVLYDHSDDTVRSLLAKVHDRLPPGGTLVVSEPMSGGETPDAITDVYFAFYTLAMRTGRTRSAAQISTLLEEAGFTQVKARKPLRSYVTSAITAVKAP